MRIGTNHGSLSDRIMSRYGDTPLGMVESALEFVRICEEQNYREIVLSMKASNPQVMVQAYRLLVMKMDEEGMNYPTHIGVTEAGGGEDGRIKSAVGIGTLLEDGIGDTVRVSLTEDPEFEAPVAIDLVDRYKERESHKEIIPVIEVPVDPFIYKRRDTFEIMNIGGSNVPVVVSDFSAIKNITPDGLSSIGYVYDTGTDKWTMSDMAADFIFTGDENISFGLPGNLKVLRNYETWRKDKRGYPVMNYSDYLAANEKSKELNFVQLELDNITESLLEELKKDKTAVIVLTTSNKHGMAEQRRAFFELMNNDVQNSVIIKRNYDKTDIDKVRLYASTDFGALLIDGLGDGIWVETTGMPGNKEIETSSQNKYVRRFINDSEKIEKIINRTLFGILQAARVRISKTEYIACPSCGRTLFDLQVTTDMIRKRTEHLKGIKIAVMGCIVNGPGEMADADYGYVGSGVGKITLYRKKEIVKRSVPAENAVDELIGLIKSDNNWIEPIN
jgi:(E)-4-hydroxy-3-methylbut-2-enyl-diphosphate synthase